jgi:hypothetical protein
MTSETEDKEFEEQFPETSKALKELRRLLSDESRGDQDEN